MEAVYRKNPDIVFRRIADECVLVPVRNNMRNLERIYSLNDVGARVWELIDGAATVGAIRSRIAEEFDVDGTTAESDLREFLAELEDIRAVEKA